MILKLVEHENHVIDMLQKTGTGGQYISLSPFASHELRKQNISFKTQDDFIDNDELEEIADRSLEEVKQFIKKADEFVNSEYNLTPFKYRIYELYLIYSHVEYIRYCFDKIYRTLEPSKVVIHESKSYFGSFGPAYLSGGREMFFDPRECLWTRVVETYRNEINMRILSEVNYPVKLKSQKPKKLFWKECLANTVFSVVNTGLKGKVLVISPYFEWKRCTTEFIESGYKPYFFNPNSIRFEVSNEVNKADVQFWMSLDVLESLDFDYHIFGKRANYIFNWHERCKKVYEKTSRLIMRMKPIAICTSAKEPLTMVACKAARDLNVPVITYQHGSEGYYRHRTVGYLNFMEADWYFSYGKKVCEIYKDMMDGMGVKGIPVGSASLDCYA